jgi:hypothetical protein
MVKAKLKQRGQQAKELSKKLKAIGKHVNVIDRSLGGALTTVPPVGALVRGSNMIVKGLDLFSELTSDLLGAPVTHPGAMGGMVAGVANGPVIRNRKAKVSGSRGAIRITHKELLTTVFGEGGGNPLVCNGTLDDTGASIYTVNAMASTTFPWLATIAKNYDMYRFKRLRFVYVPMCPTSTSGRTAIIYDPDSADPLPLDPPGLSNMSCSAEGPVWGSLCLDIKLADTNKWYYGSTTGVTSGVGAYLNQGQLAWATYSASASQLGEMFAIYDVELKDPQPTATDLAVAHGVAGDINTQYATHAGYVATAGDTAVGAQFFTPGCYYVSGRFTATAAASSLTTVNLTVVDFAKHNATSSQVLFAIVHVVATGGTFSFTGLTGLDTWDLIITPAPSNLTGSFFT